MSAFSSAFSLMPRLKYTSAPCTSPQETQAPEIQNWAVIVAKKCYLPPAFLLLLLSINSILSDWSQKGKNLHKLLCFLIPHIKLGIKFFPFYIISYWHLILAVLYSPHCALFKPHHLLQQSLQADLSTLRLMIVQPIYPTAVRGSFLNTNLTSLGS